MNSSGVVLSRLGQRPVLLLGTTAAVLVVVGLGLGWRHSKIARNTELEIFGPSTDVEASTNVKGGIVQWLSDGYRQFRGGGAFRVRQFGVWLNLVTGRKLFDELRDVPDDILSFREAAFGGLHGDYTMGSWRTESNTMAELVKGRMTRSLGTLFPAVYEEMGAAFEDEISSKLVGEHWTPMSVIMPLTRIVCRTSNRLFVGLPLCRNEEYMDLSINYTHEVVRSSDKIKVWPKILEPYYSPVANAKKILKRLMGDTVAERQQLIQNNVPHEERPNDFLQWNLEQAPDFEKNLDSVAERILRLNFTAIHTTAAGFTWVLYHLAAQPNKYMQALRDEVTESVAKHGWTKAAIDKMHRADSFIKECSRLHGINAASITRVAMRDFTFSDGTKIRRGEWVGVPSHAVHHDSLIYAHADVFDGFRFFDGDVSEGPESKRYVGLSHEFLTFGIGKHACPGRFWAANEMKAMLAYVVTHYDLKFASGTMPPEIWMGFILAPDWTAQVLMRKRA
ncbi:cytochrome P450 [Auriculariales sp. MPI-PUGE-AT-0066]|nr:cytochrome P450 [Auriculariales sp. MPI-PUGE-AT-0066]